MVSCDSRQFYTELNIGVARPTTTELATVPHHFIACRSVSSPYNVFSFEQEAVQTLDNLFQTHDTVIAVGGSGLYIEALCHGISVMPDPTPQLRAELQHKLRTDGIESLQIMLKQLDPDYFAQVDPSNGIRLQRALEVCLTAGKPYSQLIRQPLKPRPFSIESIVIERPREELRDRINQRVDIMMESGLEEEARLLYPLRHLTPLNTVGYKEFFQVWDETHITFPLDMSQRSMVADAIRLNTWHYAKKQITWLKKHRPSNSISTK